MAPRRTRSLLTHGARHATTMLALISCCVPGLRAPGPAALSRRQVLALTAATGVAPLPALADMALAPPQPSGQDFLSLKLQGRRLEPAALDAVKAFYSEDFCAYLARWLICYEPATTRWWVAKQAEARDFESAQVTRGTPFALSNDAKREVRRRISSTAAILTLTLAIRAARHPLTWSLTLAPSQKYLRSKFENLVTSVEVGLEKVPGPIGAVQLAEKLARRSPTYNSRRYLAQLFSVLGEGQPTAQIRSLIGEADNARLLGVETPRAGAVRGYSKTAPLVEVGAPGGFKGKTARVEASMRPTGDWLGVKVTNGGDGYEDGEQPRVYLSRGPAAGTSGADEISADVTISRGQVVAISLSAALARAATMPPSLTQALSEATGNAKGRVAVAVEPPRRSKVDAQGARLVSRSATADLLAEYEVAGLNVSEPGSGYLVDEPPTVSVLAPAGSAAAVARGPAKAQAAVPATPRMSPRTEDVPSGATLRELVASLEAQGGLSLPILEPKEKVQVERLPPTLIPRLQPSDGRYALPIDISPGLFGISAAKPVERKARLSGSASASLFLAGGLCSATAHTALTPLDVVKTRLQSDPPEFSGPIEAFRGVVDQDGPAGLLRGADTTALGYALSGSLSFGLEEVILRFAKEIAGPGNALLFGTPLLLCSAAAAVTISTIAVCPFETVRIRSVAEGNPDSAAVLQELLDSEGAPALYAGLVPLLFKDVPSFVTKILTFEAAIGLTSAWSASLFGDANVGLASVAPSLLAGAIAGFVAALVTQPADTLLTAVSKGSSVSDALGTIKEEPERMLRGLSTRLVYKVILTSIQFLLLSKIREGFGVSDAELTSFWDALQGVLSASTLGTR